MWSFGSLGQANRTHERPKLKSEGPGGASACSTPPAGRRALAGRPRIVLLGSTRAEWNFEDLTYNYRTELLIIRI